MITTMRTDLLALGTCSGGLDGEVLGTWSPGADVLGAPLAGGSLSGGGLLDGSASGARVFGAGVLGGARVRTVSPTAPHHGTGLSTDRSDDSTGLPPRGAPV